MSRKTHPHKRKGEPRNKPATKPRDITDSWANKLLVNLQEERKN